MPLPVPARTIIRDDPSQVEHRLRQLGLSIPVCLQVVDACVAGFAGCTENDPATARGWEAWRMGTRRFRELLRQEGWDKDDAENLATIVSHARRIRIAVVNTNEGTGLRLGNPSNKSKKGAGSERAVDHNLEPPLPLPEFERDYEEKVKAAAARGYPIFYLCVYISGDTVRAELSFPRDCDNGYLGDWAERNILIDENGPINERRKVDHDDGFAPEPPIIVRRKG